MLYTTSNIQPSSGYFELNNGRQLQINCEQSNFLFLGFGYIFGVLEHLDKIGEAGF
jgi:hypothetical protein